MFTIRARLTLVVLAMIIGLMGLYLVYLRIELVRFTEDGLGVQVRAQAKPIIDEFAAGSPAAGFNFDRLATDLTSAQTGALVLGQEGEVLGRPESGTVGAPPPIAVPGDAVRRAADGEKEVDLVGAAGGDRALISLVPLPGSEPTTVVIAMSTRLEASDRFADRLTWAAVLGAVAAVALAAVLTPVLVRRSLQPLRRMAVSARQVADGDLSQRLNLDGPRDEVRRLAQTFDEMTESLERAFVDLEASQARTRQFVDDASHELRTPLTAVAGYADLLMTAPDTMHTGERLRRLSTLRREVARTQRIVNDLLQLARLDSNPPPGGGPLELRELCAEVVEQLQPLAGARSLCVQGSAAAWADEDRVRQVLLNLLANAIRHTDAESGRIDVRLDAEEATAIMTVADNGTGMDESTRLVAFERFTRGASPVGIGSGLGLPIVASLVRTLRGEVSLVSRPGAGTTVVVRLPATEPVSANP